MQRMKSMFGDITEWTNFINFIPKFGTNNIIIAIKPGKKMK